MRLLRRRPQPGATTFRPAERYLTEAAPDARRLGCSYIGTEHLLLGLLRRDPGRATDLLRRLDVDPASVLDALGCRLQAGRPAIDAAALATLGIDYDAVVSRLEETFGAGALERTRAGCLGVCPRVKLALAFAVDDAGGGAVLDDDVLLGMLRVPDSVAGRVLAQFGVTPEAAESARIAAR
jgi:ATP-dependent Clp protease ATP-binding subunit ClpA